MGKIIFDWKMLMNSFRLLNGLIRSVSVDKMIVDYEHITDKRHLEKHGLHKSEIRVAIENGVARICAGKPPIAYVPPIRRGGLELSRDIWGVADRRSCPVLDSL